MIIVKRVEEFSKLLYTNNASWVEVPNTNFKLSHIFNLDIKFEFKFDNEYYNAGVRCLDMFEFYVHRDKEGYIKVYNNNLILLPKMAYRDNTWHKFHMNISSGVYTVKIDEEVKARNEIVSSSINNSNFEIRTHDDTTYIRNILLESPGKFLIKQSNEYYSIKSNYYNLGQPTDNIQLEQWYDKYGADDISILTTLLNSKEMVMNLDDTCKVWRTNKPIDSNEVKDNIDLIDTEESKSIKYSVENYKIYELLEDEFEVLMYESNEKNIGNAKLEIKGKRKNIFDRFNLQNPELLVYVDNKDVESASLDIEGIKQDDFKYQIKLDDEIIQDYGQFDYREINKEFMVPKEKINAAKKGNKTHILTVTMQDKEDNETVANCDINIKTQRSFSRYFKPNVDYVHISGFPKVLSEITIQIIKRAKNENEFTCITNNTLVSMSGNELKICGNSFEGWIYEVRVWEKGKEQQWTGVPLKGDEEGLIALYRMNELEESICFDSTDNKLHGTYLGTEWSEIVPTGVKEGINSEILIKDENAIVPQGKDYPCKYEIMIPYMMINEIHENDIEGDVIEFEIDGKEYKDIENISISEVK